MTIVIIGATGMLGTALSRRCTLAGLTTINCSSKTLNITNKSAVNKFFSNLKNIDAIINCAAYTNVDKAEEEPEQANTLNGTAVGYLAEAAAKKNAIFIHLSTDYVFDGALSTPYTETHTCNPINAYGYSKWLGEEACKKHTNNYYILRVQWLYGQNGNHFIKTMLSLMQTKTSLSVVNDQIGSLTSVESLAGYIISILQKKPAFGCYHISDAGYASWYDITKELAKLTDYSGSIQPVSSTKFPRPAKRPLDSRLDCSKFIAALGPIQAKWQQQLELYLKYTRKEKT